MIGGKNKSKKGVWKKRPDPLLSGGKKKVKKKNTAPGNKIHIIEFFTILILFFLNIVNQNTNMFWNEITILKLIKFS